MINITSLIELAPPFLTNPTITDGLDLYLYGLDSLSNGLNLYSHGSIQIDSSLDLNATGALISNLGVNLSAYGAYAHINSELYLFAEGDTTTPEFSLDFYAYVSDIGNEEDGVNLFAKVPEGSTIDCVAFGPGIEEDDNLNFYGFGCLSITSGLNMITGNSLDESTSSVTFYAVGF